MYIVITIFIIFLALFLFRVGQFVLQSFKLGQFYAIVFILKLLLLSKKILEIISANRGGGGGGYRLFFNGTYGDFSKSYILPLFKICPGDPHPLFFKQKVPVYFSNFAKDTPQPDASIKIKK